MGSGFIGSGQLPMDAFMVLGHQPMRAFMGSGQLPMDAFMVLGHQPMRAFMGSGQLPMDALAGAERTIGVALKSWL
jgi:hypothetical protein